MKIEFLVEGLGVYRDTAGRYLKKLNALGIVEEVKIENSKFFIKGTSKNPPQTIKVVK